MLPYPPPIRRDAAERSLVRVLGGVLASLSLLLAVLGIVFHQRKPDLIFAVIVGLFGLRILFLWLGKTSQHHKSLPARSSLERYAMRAPLVAQSQLTPPLQSQSFSQLPVEQQLQQSVPPTPLRLPRSVRPQRQPASPAFPVQSAPPLYPGVLPLPPSQPPSLWQPPLPSSFPLPLSAPVLQLPGQGNWHDDDGNRECELQRGNDHDSAE